MLFSGCAGGLWVLATLEARTKEAVNVVHRQVERLRLQPVLFSNLGQERAGARGG